MPHKLACKWHSRKVDESAPYQQYARFQKFQDSSIFGYVKGMGKPAMERRILEENLLGSIRKLACESHQIKQRIRMPRGCSMCKVLANIGVVGL